MGKLRPCYARDGSEYCLQHDPAEKERWRSTGKTRHPSFAKAALDGHEFAKAKVPTLAHLVDRAMGIADSAEAGRLEPGFAHAAVAALRLARTILEAERERQDKKRFAWEREEDARLKRESDRLSGETPNAAEGSTPPPAPSIPPWMKPRDTTSDA